jgi:hypothetical protein
MTDKIVEMRIFKKDLHYLNKVLYQAYMEAKKNYDNTKNIKPINDLWKDTITTNNRLRDEINRVEMSD